MIIGTQFTIKVQPELVAGSAGALALTLQREK
jgi:hypothetical protein